MLTRADSTGCLSQLQAVSRAPKRRIGGSGPPACEQLTLHRASCASDVPLWLSRPPHQCQLPLPSPFRVFNGLGPARRLSSAPCCTTSVRRMTPGPVLGRLGCMRLRGGSVALGRPRAIQLVSLLACPLSTFLLGPLSLKTMVLGHFQKKTARQEGEIPNPSSFLGRFSLAESRAGKLALSVPDVLDRSLSGCAANNPFMHGGCSCSPWPCRSGYACGCTLHLPRGSLSPSALPASLSCLL